MLQDAHNHLGSSELFPHADDLIKSLKASGISSCVTNATQPSDWDNVSQLATRHPDFIIPSFGLHPWFVSEAPENWRQTLKTFLKLHPQAGIGECGLDRWVKDHDIELQREYFEPQLSLAALENRPLSIHCLKAWGELLKILGASPLPERGFLVHAFSGSREVAYRLLDLGAYFSFSPYFLYDRKQQLRDLFASIPFDRILVETDSPSMAPPAEVKVDSLTSFGLGEELSHPKNLLLAAKTLISLRSENEKTVNQSIRANFEIFFA